MKKVFAFLMVLLPLLACTNSSKEDKKTIERFPGGPEWMNKTRDDTKLTRYLDSITTVYPNHEGNIVVQKTISKDFAKKMTAIPGILEGSTFHVGAIYEDHGKTGVALICNEGGVTVWCIDYSNEEAMKLDKQKAYQIVGGKIDHFKENNEEMSSIYLNLGDVYVRNAKLTEI